MTFSATLSLPLGQAAPPTRAQAEGWAVLDSDAQWSRFGRPLAQRPGCWESYLSIEGMHCAACTLAVEQALGNVPGVESVQVNGASATQGDTPMWAKMLMTVVWPAFLAACVLEAAVFALVDPHELSWGGGPLGWSRQAVYTASFFLFWVVSIGSSLLALVLARPEAAPGLHD